MGKPPYLQMGKPPYLQGMDAYRAGTKRIENPYRGKLTSDDGNYPGPWANWDAGWGHQKHLDEYDADLRKGNKAK